MRLFRAGPAGVQSFGYLTSWSNDRSYAEAYLDMPGFGGPVLYSAMIHRVRRSRVLDLRHDAWEAFVQLGLDLDDYHQPLHDTVRDVAPVLTANGYRWVVFFEGSSGDGTEWLYLGQSPIAVTPVRRSA